MKDQDISVISSHHTPQVSEESYVEFSMGPIAAVAQERGRNCKNEWWMPLQSNPRERGRERSIKQKQGTQQHAQTNLTSTHTHILHLHQADILTSFLARWQANDQPSGVSGASARTRLRLSRLRPALLWGDERGTGAGRGGREGGPLLAVEKCGWTGCHCGGPKGYGPYQDHAHCHVALPDAGNAGTGGWG